MATNEGSLQRAGAGFGNARRSWDWRGDVRNMKGPRCDRILAGMTVAVILAALFNVFAKGDDLTAVPTGASPAGQFDGNIFGSYSACERLARGDH